MQFHKGSFVIAYHTWLCMIDRNNKRINEKCLSQTILPKEYFGCFWNVDLFFVLQYVQTWTLGKHQSLQECIRNCGIELIKSLLSTDLKSIGGDFREDNRWLLHRVQGALLSAWSKVIIFNKWILTLHLGFYWATVRWVATKHVFNFLQIQNL